MMIQLLQRDFDQQNCDSIGKTLRLSKFIKAGTGKALIFPAWDGHGLLFEVGIARAPACASTTKCCPLVISTTK